PAALGDSNQVDIGDFVLAVGSPFGLDNSVTFGIVSAIGRRTISLASNVSLQDFIQTDAAINPGNSGGPLLDLNAEVIGMNTAIASNSGNNAGIAFSIPIRMVTLVADQLIMYGKTRRAYLGVNLEKNFTIQQAREIGLERPRGALVTTVLNPSPAYQAKFRKGDLILEFNGIPVEDDMHLYNLVNLTEIDEKVTLKVYRAGEIYEVEVQLWER
ncbi:MAG: PDZ domain-containing protein, partial [Thermoguttaceae bacterium]|nr:PDZ domain-containing protein [Thermoguttaceae bacterium]